MDIVQKHIYSNYHSLSSEPYRVCPAFSPHVAPKHVLIEFKKWMCYIDGQKNKYSYFTFQTT
jgi:hypothetical protein